MPRPENLIPAKKGEPSRNPKGRGKGTRNRSTVVREWIEAYLKAKNPITGKDEKMQVQDKMVLALINKAFKGDVAAFRELMDSGHGKVKEQIDHTSGGEKIETNQININYEGKSINLKT